ncbi:phosphotransferase family protein [Mycobacterium sp. E796]|uniref:phosphotransferase family protein n=1 Tax=Mycobacterium sp. E796 TaxID=1834151 RepID=UPI000A6B2E1B|nr:phosphotransferase family protein [Mycobacterium sp. E796]
MIDEESLIKDLTRWLIDDLRAGTRIDGVQALSGGYSQMMIAFTLHDDEHARRLVLRANRPSNEAVTATDRSLEYATIASLSGRGNVPLPAPHWFDGGAALGVPCFVVDHIDGTSMSVACRGLSETARDELGHKLCDLMVAIHSTPIDSLPSELDVPTDWYGYVDSIIQRWRQIERSAPEPDPFVRYLANWLQRNKPAPAPMTLIHGELNNDNILLRSDGELSAVDWEFARIGDPREDIGWYRAASNGAAPPDVLAGDFDGFCERYRTATGLGSDVINPASIGYFGLLATVNAYSSLVQTCATVESNLGGPVLTAYMSAVLGRLQLNIMQTIRDLDGNAVHDTRPQRG